MYFIATIQGPPIPTEDLTFTEPTIGKKAVCSCPGISRLEGMGKGKQPRGHDHGGIQRHLANVGTKWVVDALPIFKDRIKSEIRKSGSVLSLHSARVKFIVVYDPFVTFLNRYLFLQPRHFERQIK